MYYIADLSALLKSLEQQLDRNNAGLKSLVSMRLYHTMAKGKRQFYKIKSGFNTNHRTAINSYPTLVKQLIWKVIKEKENEILREDIKLLRNLIEKFRNTDMNNVLMGNILRNRHGITVSSSHKTE